MQTIPSLLSGLREPRAVLQLACSHTASLGAPPVLGAPRPGGCCRDSHGTPQRPLPDTEAPPSLSTAGQELWERGFTVTRAQHQALASNRCSIHI